MTQLQDPHTSTPPALLNPTPATLHIGDLVVATLRHSDIVEQRLAVVRQLERWGFGMIDCQMHTAHLGRMGGREIPRAAFMRKLGELVNYPPISGTWVLDHDLA